jgi:hypothetical protein
MAEAADSLHGDKVARERAAMAESIECRDSGAHEGRGFRSVKRLRHPRQGFDRRDHEFLVSAVVTDSAHQAIRTVYEVASPAGQTGAVLPAVPTYANPVSLTPAIHIRSELVDCPGDFVSGNARIRDAGKLAFFRDHVAVANSTGLNANPDLSWPGLWDLPFDDLEVSPSPGYLNSFHLRHEAPPVGSVTTSRRAPNSKAPTLD